MSCSSFSCIFHQHHLQVPVSSGSLTGLTSTLIADSFVKRLDTFQITATHSKHWIQVEINKCRRQYGFTSYNSNLVNRNLVKRQKSERGGGAQRTKLYLEPTKWGQEKVIAKQKICPCCVQRWHHMPLAVPGHCQPDSVFQMSQQGDLRQFPPMFPKNRIWGVGSLLVLVRALL